MFGKSDREVANAYMDKVVEALQKGDKDALKAMFSKNAIEEAENFDESIDDLFDFFQGDFVSYNDWGALSVEEGKNDDGTGRNWKEISSTYDVVTNKQEYRFAIIKNFVIDTANPDNIGIHSLYVILAENTDRQRAYWGDAKDTPGINFNKVYVRPNEATN